jgi:hypothetical protein
MTAQPLDPYRTGLQPPSVGIASGYYQAVGNIVFAADEALPIDLTAREFEIPRTSTLLHHLAGAAGQGGVVYLTLHGRRVAAVVPPDVAESWEDEEPEREPGSGLQEILDDMEARLGPIPPEIAEEVDRQWAAAVAR